MGNILLMIFIEYKKKYLRKKMLFLNHSIKQDSNTFNNQFIALVVLSNTFGATFAAYFQICS